MNFLLVAENNISVNGINWPLNLMMVRIRKPHWKFKVTKLSRWWFIMRVKNFESLKWNWLSLWRLFMDFFDRAYIYKMNQTCTLIARFFDIGAGVSVRKSNSNGWFQKQKVCLCYYTLINVQKFGRY